MEDGDGSASIQSILHIHASELYPKQQLLAEDDLLNPPFTPLCGESIEYLGRSIDGVLALSNYRLYHQIFDSSIYFNIPLGLIEQIEVKEILYLHISCKDARVCRCMFTTNEQCMEWCRRLTKAISPPKNIEDVFAFALYAWSKEEGGEEVLERLSREHISPSVSFQSEVERLMFDVSKHGPWRISTANAEHRLCPTYPRQLLVPSCITDEVLESAARFRSARRVPVVVWRHCKNGAVIARCSQPEVGWLGWRSGEDEELLKAIADACFQSLPSTSLHRQPKKLLIMDARSYTTAVANRARGGGCECPEYYPNCEIQFMNLANIHAIRKSFHSLRQLCSSPPADQLNWFSLLEGTRWFQNMSGLLNAAITLASAIEHEGRPTLVHCSDGWDRTPQIVSLAQILLDPFYRTTEGFKTLVEREWLEFGHKFADRCGLTEDINERCPIFLQWLDCVHNLVKQFPCAFEISRNYLVKLAQHAYSNLFGTFLCNSAAERSSLNVQQRTFSVWSFLQSPDYYNHLYSSSSDHVLWPSCNVRDLEVWKELYFGFCSTPSENVSTTNRDIYRPHAVINSISFEYSRTGTEDDNDNGEEQRKESKIRSISPLVDCLSDDQCVDKKINLIMDSISNSEQAIVSGVDENEEKNGSKVINNPIIEITTQVDLSVDSSTETLIPCVDSTPGDSEKVEPFTNEDESLKADNSKVSTPVSGFAILDPLDGLMPLNDDIQTRLSQINLEHKEKESALERDLRATRLALLQQVCHQCSHPNSTDERRLDDDGSICSTEVSWEAVEEHEATPTLWVPDHAVSHCMGCQNQFWLGRRKHHCRSCGKIFCADCSENAVALPEEQLYEPVRVCATCYNNPLTTCKQQAQASSESQNTSIVLPPAHT